MTVRNISYSFSFKVYVLWFAISFPFSWVNSQPQYLNFDNFTIENGLSNNVIHSIYQDKKGWMWFGTSQGLNRFDGYKFTCFYYNPSNPQSLVGKLIRCIFEDKQGALWIGTENGGLNKFDFKQETFSHFYSPFRNFTLKGSTVNKILQDKSGILWLATNEGLVQFDPRGKIKGLYHHIPGNNNSLTDNVIKDMRFDSYGNIWIGTNSGLDIFNPGTGIFRHVAIPKEEILTVFRDDDGQMWVGTISHGIFQVNQFTLKWKRLIIDSKNERAVTVRSIVKDKSGLYWIGTRGGLYIYSKENRKFSFFRHDDREPQSLCHNSIMDIFRDAKGDFWIATRSGLSHVVAEKQVFRTYKAMPNDHHYLNNGEIYAFWMDPQGKLYIGTEEGGINVFNSKTKTFSYITQSRNGLQMNCIKALMGDKSGNLWVGTYGGGLSVISLKTGHVANFMNKPGENKSLHHNIVWSLLTDNKKNIWVGTEAGLDRFEPKSKIFIHYPNVIREEVLWIKNDSQGDLWLGSNNKLVIWNPNTGKIRRFNVRIRMMYEDRHGRYWLTSMDYGLILFDKNKGIIKCYDQTKGIANNQAYCILEDNRGYFWISTINGLSRFDPLKGIFKNFDRENGLQNNQFQYGACYKTPNGELIFGGISGFSIFDPAKIKDNLYRPPIMLTGLKIFNKEVHIGTSLLDQSISEAREIKLPYNQNIFSLEFAALNYANVIKNQYQYKLKGFEKEWNAATVQHSVTYTNLNPGNYLFMVRGSNDDGIWSDKMLSIKIKILPPFWMTWWFRMLMVLLLSIAVYYLFLFWENRRRLQYALDYERERTKKLHDLDMMKVNFFTNISHELRTPLTLIISPIEKMLDSNMTAKEMKVYLAMIRRNARQLLKLVNQLLDFRKIESGKMKIELSQGDIISFIREIVDSFVQMAEEKHIDLKFNADENELFTSFDTDKLEKIINNLISNALKFTPEGGFVWVNLSLQPDENDSNKSGKFIQIVVEDNGIGIPEANLNKIFTLFFQSPNAKGQTGSGIGLALTKELVDLHHGTIALKSKPGEGTCVTVRLPYNLKTEEQAVASESIAPETIDRFSNKDSDSSSGKIMLVVDDHPDIRFFIRSNFDHEFNVLEASNGKEGLALAFKHIPDIIISDIMMSPVDGNEFCQKIKNDERTSHIPFILLSALSSKDHQMEGNKTGADEYITKPFDMEFLRTKVNNLLSIRETLRKKYSEEMVLMPTDVTITSPDEHFLQKVIAVIEKNLADPDLDIDKIAHEVGVSRTQLYRKLSVYTEMTVREFVRNIRLKRAAQLLEQNKLNVSEVAFAVGFKDLSHFRKCFRQEFGMSASQYAKGDASSSSQVHS